MAIRTIPIEPGNSLSRRMAGAAVQQNMIPAERPAGIAMRKRRFFPCIMAFRTLVLSMAAGADGVNLFIGFFQIGRFLKIMTVSAVFLLMAIHTAQAE